MYQLNPAVIESSINPLNNEKINKKDNNTHVNKTYKKSQKNWDFLI